MKMRIWGLMLSLLLLGAPFAGMESVQAASETAGIQQRKENGEKSEKRAGPPRRPQMTMEEMQLVLSRKYRVDAEEAKRWLDSGVSFRELERAALYSYISGKTVGEVLELRKDEVWTRVQYLLRITPERYQKKQTELRADNLYRWWGIPNEIGIRYMTEGYPMHYVKVAWILSRHSGWTMDRILKDRRYTESWKDWTKRNLGVGGDVYDQWIGKYTNPTYFPGKYF